MSTLPEMYKKSMNSVEFFGAMAYNDKSYVQNTLIRSNSFRSAADAGSLSGIALFLGEICKRIFIN